MENIKSENGYSNGIDPDLTFVAHSLYPKTQMTEAEIARWHPPIKPGTPKLPLEVQDLESVPRAGISPDAIDQGDLSQPPTSSI
jgi:hypothetical protein